MVSEIYWFIISNEVDMNKPGLDFLPRFLSKFELRLYLVWFDIREWHQS